MMWNAPAVTVSFLDNLGLTSRHGANPPRNRKDDWPNIRTFNPGIVAP